MRVGVIGGGPAGLTAAYRLAREGADVTVFEAGPYLGGMARSFDLWGQRVDLGPHRLFSADSRVNDLWNELIGSDCRIVQRQTRILYRQRFFDYPLSVGNVLANLGPADVVRCIASYVKEQVRPERSVDERKTFEDWVVHSFGRRLFEMFFKSYSEKLWGIPCNALDADFAAQRIRRFSLGQSMLAALGIGRRRHKTLTDAFAYPKNGSGEFYDRMGAAISAKGGKIRMRTPVGRVLMSGGRATGLVLRDGSQHDFDHIVSTMPLTLLIKGIGEAPQAVVEAAGSLRFRNTILVYLKVESPSLFPDQWLYIHAGDVAVGRVTNFRNWVPELYGESKASIISLEYWCNDEDAIWSEPDAGLIERAAREAGAIGLLKSAPVSAGHVERVPRCYPVYGRGYKATLAPVVTYLRSIANLWPISRYGAFKYNNQDHSILMGLLVAENIGGTGMHDLWAVNSDYDSYQEEARAGA